MLGLRQTRKISCENSSGLRRNDGTENSDQGNMGLPNIRLKLTATLGGS